MTPKTHLVAVHYRNYENLSQMMGIPKNNGLPDFDYETRRILDRLQAAAGGFNQQLDNDVSLILNNYLTYGRRIFDLHSRKAKSVYHKQLQEVLKLYKVHRYIAEEGQARNTRKISIDQLMMCLPHLTAKIYIFDLGVEPAMSDSKMTENQFTCLSPACAIFSSFALMPQYEDDADANFMHIIKAMLLFQFEELEEVERDNALYHQHTDEMKMSRLISIGKVIYESFHMCADMRWFCYNAFFIKQFHTLKLYNHAGPASVFDERFQNLTEDVAAAFTLRKGSKRTLQLTQKQIDHFLKNQELLEDHQC